jgi:hypothetical protein
MLNRVDKQQQPDADVHKENVDLSASNVDRWISRGVLCLLVQAELTFFFEFPTSMVALATVPMLFMKSD